MSGHSKWANIKNRKAKVDEKRGRLFTKIGREIIIAARMGGGDPEGNMRLKAAIAKAKAANMPNENIQRAIMRGTGELEGAAYEEMTYEGYGPGGVAMLLNIATDNRNRTASEIRYIFSRGGGNLGESGCVAWMFNPKGVITVEVPAGDKREEVILQAIEAGAEDVDDEDDEVLEIKTAPGDLEAVREALEASGVTITHAEVEMVPQTTVTIDDPETAGKVMRLIERLEDHDDVQAVYTNADIPAAIMDQLDI
ncbi:YebC/PmpR family DNA-binding transcriptional regulator [Neomoorella thermoacetica]|uniref:Probable transcriptional regulatory protein Moth_1704 n=1 Tax=Moorella thermoacetica (strain ATCC 39073 / JCM 9320) TaxID=264732 RepID=Y1704_MOOTA|nr:YebC/PmpR family DNA-binding transcriptional regulator [Moorella thermoacetica]Q2RHT3.1 RecName: Full=Probable transcriptional regulatory protein Moth_1704 [Moorella thermoacetica ATCC 39073]AKX94504.1 putative transcriptional regulatory protein [Moorella thermoacetica]AKX97140.1 putative transcriptional regulatory protein [Moorella thermoacetica]APC08894.1 putative transcriptional regulatory protein [Moorella thermoacetica]OIQ55155.1 putative transcriptional regulatory protein [Moorella th